MALDYNQLVSKLLDELKKSTQADAVKLEAFAAQFGPAYAVLKQQGDNDACEEIFVSALNEAAVLGIDDQAEFEQALKNALDIATAAALR